MINVQKIIFFSSWLLSLSELKKYFKKQRCTINSQNSGKNNNVWPNLIFEQLFFNRPNSSFTSYFLIYAWIIYTCQICIFCSVGTCKSRDVPDIRLLSGYPAHFQLSGIRLSGIRLISNIRLDSWILKHYPAGYPDSS